MEQNSVDLKRLNSLFDCYGFPLGLPEDVEEKRVKLDLLETRLYDDFRNVQYRPCVQVLFREYCFVRSINVVPIPIGNFDNIIP